MNISRLIALVLINAGLAGIACTAAGQDEMQWSRRAADSATARWPNGRFVSEDAPWNWNYELGTLLQGMSAVGRITDDKRYFDYIQNSVDQFVTPEGAIPTYKVEDKELDSILLGRQLLHLYVATRDKRYLTAATLLEKQLDQQPRTPSGGFWHKQRYPNQMWLDGLYMAEPFRAEYAKLEHDPEAFADITHQFALIEEHARDAKTGLIYHGWDESKQQPWANKETGDSPEFWGRAMGWYMMALVDTLDFYPDGDPGKKQLIAFLVRDAAAVERYQDTASGDWYQVLDKGSAKGNYLEASASCMFVYALAKGVHRGYLPKRYLTVAGRGYHGILTHFTQTGPGENVSLTGTVKVGGLGGNPYRDGTFAYYTGEKVVTDDPKGVGVFLMAASEMESAHRSKLVTH